MEINFTGWVERACGCVRFRPDRRAIRKELWTHYEDHCRDLERLEFEPALARQRALEAMGDPLEVGRALDRVHKPWLGWLWEASRGILAGLILLNLVTLLHTTGLPFLARKLQGQLEELPEAAAWVELEHGTLYAAPGAVTELEGDGLYAAEVELWVRTERPMGAEYGEATRMLAYRDGEGEIPLYKMDDRTRTLPENRYWQYRNYWKTPAGWTQYRQTVELVLDRPPKWVEISYPLSGQDWTLRLEWGVGP